MEVMKKDKRAGQLLGYASAKGVTSVLVLVQIDEGTQYVFLMRPIGSQHSVQSSTSLRKNLARPQHLSKGLSWHPSICRQREDDPPNPSMRNGDNSSIPLHLSVRNALTFAEVNNFSHDFQSMTFRDRAAKPRRARNLHTPIFPLLPEVLGRIFLINTQRNARTDTIQKRLQALYLKSAITGEPSPLARPSFGVAL